MAASMRNRTGTVLQRIREQRLVRAFRRFRRTRPFWAAVLVGAAGIEIGYLPLGPVNILIHAGPGAVYGLGCSVLLLVMAALMLIAPTQHVTSGVIAVIVGLASFILSNLGGFVVGMILATAGGSLAVGWVPDKRVFGTSTRRFRRNRPGPSEPDTASPDTASPHTTSPHTTSPRRPAPAPLPISTHEDNLVHEGDVRR